MEKKNNQWGYKRLGTEQWILSDNNGIISLHPFIKHTIYSTDWIKLNYKIGKKFKEQQYSDLIAYPLTKLTPTL